MPFAYRIDQERSLILLEPSGSVDMSQIEELVRQLLADPGLRPGLRILSEHSNLQVAGTKDLAKAVPKFVAQLGERLGPFRCALIVPSELSFGMARMIEVFTEGTHAEIRAFRSSKDAEIWLGKPPTPS